MKYPKYGLVILLGFLLLFSLALSACGQEPEEVEVTRIVEQTVEVEVPGPEIEVTRVVESTVEVEAELDRGAKVASEIPFVALWEGSGHNDVEAEAFNHWNEDDPAEVEASCARCHSTPGYLDYLGVDGTDFGVVDNAAPIGTTVECQACHNEVTIELTSVTFPSGVEITGLGDDSRCMVCHQGRESTVSVNQSIVDAGLGPDDEDTVSEDLGFRNIHYYAAAATLYGTETKGGFEYEGKSYDAKFDHVPGYDTCIDCHDMHTLEVRFDECTACHQGLAGTEDLVNIRMPGSLVDYDGDGDMSEGIFFEIQGMQQMLYQALQAYANELPGVAIVYESHSYPYFFIDTNADGEAGEDEANFGNRYASWTPRLLKAAYNYQVSFKDPGEFAHGGKYIIQLLYDSIESLNEAIGTPVDLSNAHRLDHGHFAGSEEAFRHWDEDGHVPGSCSKCHSAAGLPLFLEQGVTINQPLANGLNCATCHNDLTTFTRFESGEVDFPSGATLTLEDEANLCINCHQGRNSGPNVARLVADKEDDTVDEGLRFQNIHYFAAGATLFGTEAKGMFEYEGQEYLGRNGHVGRFDTCIECHSTHALEVKYEDCGGCHDNVETDDDLHDIRVSESDFDGDGDVTEGLYGEIDTMRQLLYEAMQAYTAVNDATAAIVYDAHAYPYFFADADGDGQGDERYATFTPRLLRATYNYQYAQKDPGAFAHNGLYVIQVLYDTLSDIGADTSGMIRP